MTPTSALQAAMPVTCAGHNRQGPLCCAVAQAPRLGPEESNLEQSFYKTAPGQNQILLNKSSVCDRRGRHYAWSSSATHVGGPHAPLKSLNFTTLPQADFDPDALPVATVRIRHSAAICLMYASDRRSGYERILSISRIRGDVVIHINGGHSRPHHHIDAFDTSCTHSGR